MLDLIGLLIRAFFLLIVGLGYILAWLLRLLIELGGDIRRARKIRREGLDA